jgi:hypothetical protein
MENISRGPTFGDFVTILTEGSMQDNTVARLQSTDSLPPLLNVMYYVRISLRTIKIFLAKTKGKDLDEWIPEKSIPVSPSRVLKYLRAGRNVRDGRVTVCVSVTVENVCFVVQ